MTLTELQAKWSQNCEAYKTKEIGSGVHSFVKDVFSCPDLFALTECASKSTKAGTFVHDTQATQQGRPDFVLHVQADIEIPVEVKCYTRIEEGVKQLFRYQIALSKQYGILTDGEEWRFYRGSRYERFKWADLLANPTQFQLFWQDYVKTETYYIELFNRPEQADLFESRVNLDESENRKLFFEDTTKLIAKFKGKMQALGVWGLDFEHAYEKTTVETSYAYLIQFILYKVLVDNGYGQLQREYDALMRRMAKYIKDKDFYTPIMREISDIARYISQDVYKPFKKEQENITEKLFSTIKEPTLDEIAPWLDILVYINKYNFANLKNEIFGFIYENYLKDLYPEGDKGQYFTDPAVVNFMLEEVGYTPKTISTHTNNLSLIDPSCGAGTFLYSAVDKIIAALDDNTEEVSKQIEELVDRNIFGLDIAEFPLYLAEMSILMRLLPLIVNDNFKNPIDNKLKIFKTKDSIAEFLGTGISSRQADTVDLFSHLEAVALDYPSFMRDEKDLQEMLLSLQEHMGTRSRFDYVVGNPPYVGYNVCCKQKAPFTLRIKDKSDSSITLGNVYGINLHSISGKPKNYAPKPNLYAFFIALGLALLKEGGKLCYIIPQTLLTAGDLDVLRYHLSHFVTIEKIITFEGNLFIGRGLTQKKPVATSSLILIVSKKNPSAQHQVKVVTYEPYTDEQKMDLTQYLHSQNKTVKKVFQQELKERVENWNFIKQDALFADLLTSYIQNTEDIAFYYDHKMANARYGTSFWFDKGLVFDKKKIENNRYNKWKILTKNKKLYSLAMSDFSIAEKYLRVPQGSQGLTLFENKYKIVWSYMNFDKFYFSRNPIIIDFNWVIISSKHEHEILFLLAILNSSLSKKILEGYLRNANEAAILVGIKAIKQYIRIPKITSQNQPLKEEIIAQTKKMLALEHVTLGQIVNLSSVQIQKFTNVYVKEGKLYLKSPNKELYLSILPGKEKWVEDLFPQGLFEDKEYTLTELKHMPVVDVVLRDQLKDYVDDLVFALYFNIPLKKWGFEKATYVHSAVQQHPLYNYVSL